MATVAELRGLMDKASYLAELSGRDAEHCARMALTEAGIRPDDVLTVTLFGRRQWVRPYWSRYTQGWDLRYFLGHVRVNCHRIRADGQPWARSGLIEVPIEKLLDAAGALALE